MLGDLLDSQEGTLPETNNSHLKVDGWNTSFLLGWPIFRGELLVSGSVTIFFTDFEEPIGQFGEFS